jgi:hypothetical protein
MKLIMSAGALALLAATAQGGFVQSTNSIGDNSMLLSDFVTANSVNAANLRINHIASVSSGNQMNFISVPSALDNTINGDFTVTVTSNDSGSVFLGDVASFYGGNNDNWFNAGTVGTPDDGTNILTMGYGLANSRSVSMAFLPGVTAFGFNYDDIDSSTLEITWNSGVTEMISLSSAEGFVSIVASGMDTINSLKLTQVGSGDGLSFYGFQTVQVVPLPTGALAGLGILGGLGVIRTVRRR